MSTTTQTRTSRTSKTPTPKARTAPTRRAAKTPDNSKPAEVPLLLHTMGTMALYDGNEPDFEVICAMMPGLMKAVRERRMAEGPEQGTVSVESIVEAIYKGDLAKSRNGGNGYMYERHSRFRDAVGPQDFGAGVYGDEFLDELLALHGQDGFFVGMAYAYYFMVETGVIGGAR